MNLTSNIIIRILFRVNDPVDKIHECEDKFIVSEGEGEVEGVHLFLEECLGFHFLWGFVLDCNNFIMPSYSNPDKT